MARRNKTDARAPHSKQAGAVMINITPETPAEVTGSRSVAFAMSLIERLADTTRLNGPTNLGQSRAMQAAFDALRGLKPSDEAEGMLAAHMVMAHNAVMDCMRRAMLNDQTLEGRDQNLKFALKFMAIYEQQLAAFDKRCGVGQQKITVEHVNVHAGGQAIVGDVTTHQLNSTSDPAAPPPPPLVVRTLTNNSAASGDGEKLRQDSPARPPIRGKG